MAKTNNREKLTYKQMLSYMDFLNSKLNQSHENLSSGVSGLGYCLRSLLQFMGKEEEFTEFLKKKEEDAKKAEEELGSDAQNKTIKMEK
tara:strand:- start:235 stop:501 length:267 start_codon:yes stop_codon:yes gene_type:complete